MKLRSQLPRIAAACAVLAPFALSVAAHTVPSRPRPAVASERPALRFGEYLVNLGRMPEGSRAQGVFRFMNAGDAPLTLLGSDPSCGCLKPHFPKTTFDMGEAGTFVVLADTSGEGSDRSDSLKQHFVDVRYEAGDGPRTARVHLKFVLPARRIVVEPRSLLVYQFNGQATTQEITVTDRRTPPAAVTNVACADPGVIVEPRLAETRLDPSRATIAVTFSGSLTSDVNTKLVIQTDDPDQPAIVIPIAVRTQAPPPATVGGVPLELIPNDAVRR